MQNNKKEKIDLIQNKALELSLFLSIPAAIALLIASEEIMSCLFGYGSFDEESVMNSAKALFFFAIGLEIGFLIIPVATTISSWFNAIFLFILLKKKKLFSFNSIFIDRFIKILVASILMGIFFDYLIDFFDSKLIYEETYKSIYLMGTVILGLTFYILVAIFIKAFKISDIHLKY